MKKTILVLSLSAFALVACSKPAPQTDNTPVENQTTVAQPAANSVDSTTPVANTTAADWAGKYKGLVPCADCEGIETELELNADNTYEFEQEYKGKGTDNKFKVNGTYTIDAANPSMISLDQAGDNRKFSKEGDSIHMLNADGQKAEGALASNYILKKD